MSDGASPIPDELGRYLAAYVRAHRGKGGAVKQALLVPRFGRPSRCLDARVGVPRALVRRGAKRKIPGS